MITDEQISDVLMNQLLMAEVGNMGNAFFEPTIVVTKPMWDRVEERYKSNQMCGDIGMPIDTFIETPTYIYGNESTPPEFQFSVCFNRQTMTITEAFHLVAKQDPRAKAA